MPIKKCPGGGYQYGSQKCYRGKNARNKAVKQMRAIKASEARRGKRG